MKQSKYLERLIQFDRKVANLPNLESWINHKDKNHLFRRLQQRAIDWNMIKLVIAYGRHQYWGGAQSWTLLDKNLKSTPYEKLTDRLRGLRIIAEVDDSEDTLRVSTAYWVYDLRN